MRLPQIQNSSLDARIVDEKAIIVSVLPGGKFYLGSNPIEKIEYSWEIFGALGKNLRIADCLSKWR